MTPPLDARLLGDARDARERVIDFQHELDRARADYQHAIRRLHAAGGSLREIAESLDLSHQRVHQIVEEAPGEPLRRARPKPFADRVRGRVKWSFERFTRRAREVVVLAEEEARALGHDYVGTEHLLLGLVRLNRERPARALESLGIDAERVRAEVGRVVKAGSGSPSGRLRFTTRAKRALENSLREALDLGHNYIGPEHILLGLVRDAESVAAKILAELGSNADRVREATVQAAADREG